MWFSSVLDFLTSRTLGTTGQKNRRRRARRDDARRRWRPSLEWLEDRVTPATMLVDTFADDPSDGLTLREAIALAADPATHAGDDAIVLPHEIGGDAGTYALRLGQLLIDDATGKLTIMSDGGPATIDAQQNSRVFEVFAGSEVEFQGLTITRGWADYGGGIYNLGTATLTASTLSGNRAILHDGGGIWNGPTATLFVSDHSTVSRNSASFGGGIYNHGTATVVDSTLSDNSADYGGGILNFGTGTFNLTASNLNDNSAVYDGGGIWNYGTATLFVTDLSTLSGNSAAYGGGIHNGGTATITASTLSGNQAILHDGGGIWNGPTAMLFVTDLSTLSGNSAGFGGGIYNHGTATVVDSTLSDNSADYGGGILNFGTGTFAITGSTLRSNSAGFNGGGIWNFVTATLTVTDNSTISGNSASVGGGGIHNDGTATLAGSTLSGNSADYGGGIYNFGTATLTVTASTLSGNSADYGGGIYNIGTAMVSGSTVSNNSADYGAGILNFVTGTLTVSASTLSGNSADFGGGIYNYIVGTATLAVSASTLSGNSADFGGGIYNDGTATLVVTASDVSGNEGALGGGGILTYSTATITASTISGNTGEGVAIQGGSGTQLLGNTITGNSKSGVLVSGTNHLIGGPVAGNTIAFNGGAGVAVVESSTGIAIRGNAIYDNAGPGIDLGDDGLTANDPVDADDGPNHLQNLPVLVLARSAAAGTTISGTLNSTANTRFLIDFYASPPPGSPPGMTYIGSGLVLTDGGGNVDFEVTLPAPVTAGWGITATATTSDIAPFGNTSELALGIPVFATNHAPVIGNQTFSINENREGGTAVGMVAASDLDAGQTLSYQIIAGNAAGAFALNASTGQITVANAAALDYETTPGFALIVQVTDNGSPALSRTATITINLNNLNDAPVNSVPAGSQSVANKNSLVFSQATGNAISIADPDASTALIEISLSVLHGTLTLAGTAGLTFHVGDGTSDGSLTFRGTIAAINAALDGLTYTPAKGYIGGDSLTITTSDLGSGIGDPLLDADVVAILVKGKK